MEFKDAHLASKSKAIKALNKHQETEDAAKEVSKWECEKIVTLAYNDRTLFINTANPELNFWLVDND